MVTSGALCPNGYKQTEVGVIPDGWEIRPFLSTVRIANGQVSPMIEPYKSMILVAPDHIESSTGRLLAKVTAADQRAISGKYLFESGDIVYSKIRPYLRKAILADFSGLCSADMYPLKPSTDISAGFIFAVILGYRFSKYAESVSVRSGMPKINRTEMAEFSLALPPLPEQEAIAEALSDADALIESLEQLIAKKRQIKQGAMQELLTGKRRLPGFSGEWEMKKLGDIATLYQPTTISAHQFTDTGFPVYGANGIVGYFNRYNHELWQVTVTCRGSTCGTVNKTVDKCWITGNAMVIGCDESKIINKSFIYYKLSSQDLTICITGTGQPQIVRTPLANYELFIPLDSKEQIAIATILSDIDAEITTLKTKLTKARHIKQGMMQELLTGRIRLA